MTTEWVSPYPAAGEFEPGDEVRDWADGVTWVFNGSSWVRTPGCPPVPRPVLVPWQARWAMGDAPGELAWLRQRWLAADGSYAAAEALLAFLAALDQVQSIAELYEAGR